MNLTRPSLCFSIFTLGVVALWCATVVAQEVVDVQIGSEPEAPAPAAVEPKKIPEDTLLLRFTPEPIPAPGVMWLKGDGSPTTLEDYRGKWVVLNLWATWCAPCVAEMPTLDKLHRRYNQAGLEVIAVNVDTQQRQDNTRAQVSIAGIEQFYRQVGVRFLPVHIDLEDHLTFAYRAKRLPSTYLINPDGMIVAVLDGAEDWFSPAMRRFIERLLRQSAMEAVTEEAPEGAAAVKDIF